LWKKLSQPKENKQYKSYSVTILLFCHFSCCMVRVQCQFVPDRCVPERSSWTMRPCAIHPFVGAGGWERGYVWSVGAGGRFRWAKPGLPRVVCREPRVSASRCVIFHSLSAVQWWDTSVRDTCSKDVSSKERIIQGYASSKISGTHRSETLCYSIS